MTATLIVERRIDILRGLGVGKTNMSKATMFELILVPSSDSADACSAEYQAELKEFTSQARVTSQRGFAMDSVVGGGGPIGVHVHMRRCGRATAYLRLPAILHLAPATTALYMPTKPFGGSGRSLQINTQS